MKRLFIFVGESSGDLHGSHLVKEIRKLAPELLVEGVSGPKMRAEGVSGPLKMEDFGMMGLSDVLKSCHKIFRYFFVVRNYILKNDPQVVVLIDYPGFNLRLAAGLRKKGYKGKIIHYVSPSVWAWGDYRIEEMAKSLDLLLLIYPFEEKFFENRPLKVEYVGNPLCEYIRAYEYDHQWKARLQIPQRGRLVSIFPGSRPGEVSRNLPIILEVASLLAEEYPEVIFSFNFLSSSMHTAANRIFEGQYDISRNAPINLLFISYVKNRET